MYHQRCFHPCFLILLLGYTFTGMSKVLRNATSQHHGKSLCSPPTLTVKFSFIISSTSRCLGRFTNREPNQGIIPQQHKINYPELPRSSTQCPRVSYARHIQCMYAAYTVLGPGQISSHALTIGTNRLKCHIYPRRLYHSFNRRC